MSIEQVKGGCFHDGSEGIRQGEGDNAVDADVDIRAYFVSVLNEFKETFGVPERIFYPACGNDASVIYAFKDCDAKIVYLDPSNSILDVQKHVENQADIKASLKFLKSKIQDFVNDEEFKARFDLLISIHSHAPFEQEIASLKSGGYLIIATKGSDKALDSSELELRSAVHIHEDNSGERRVIFDTDTDRYYELDPEVQGMTFSNRRKCKANFYIFRKIRTQYKS